MTRANEFVEQALEQPAAGAWDAGAAYGGALGPAMQSAIGVVGESGGPVRNVAGLGIALVLDTKSAGPKRLPALKPPLAPNTGMIIRFPGPRNVRPRNPRE